jgi:hypothetical protein
LEVELAAMTRASRLQHALQIITEVPYFGGASGSTLEEARSARESAAIRHRPVFDLGGWAMSVDGAPLRCDMFEEPR